MVSDKHTEKLIQSVNELQSRSKHALLILFYVDSVGGTMVGDDIFSLYRELRRVGWNRKSPVECLDVIIHTNGGDPAAGYRMAQTIRDASKKVTMIVVEHAYSAGTLLCFCSDNIILADNAGLSPIDITMSWEGDEEDTPNEDIELLSIDYFRNYAVDCRLRMDKALRDNHLNGKSDVESQLLVEMTRQVGAINIGHLFRERVYFIK